MVKNRLVMLMIVTCGWLQAQKLSIGKHVFGVQFIWGHYGSATITQEGNILRIEGSQYSKDKSEYCKIKGEIETLSDTRFKVKGVISTMLKDCCGEVEKTGEFIFLRSGKRKFWRMQQAEQFCDPYTKCAYYIDVFQ
jgi:hypothetical protein